MELEALSTVVGGPFTMVQGSNSLISEGSISSKGVAQNITSPITGTTMTTANTWYPVLSLRLKPSTLNGIALLDNFQIATIDNTNIFYRLVRNADLGVTGANGWLDMPDSNAFTQYQVYAAPGAVIPANQGVAIYSGFVVAGGGGAAVNLSKDSIYQIGRTQLGTTSDTYTLLCASNNANKAALASLTWIEQR